MVSKDLCIVRKTEKKTTKKLFITHVQKFIKNLKLLLLMHAFCFWYSLVVAAFFLIDGLRYGLRHCLREDSEVL